MRRRNKVKSKTAHGSVMVDAALSVGIFLLTIFSALELSLYLYTMVSLRYLVQDTVRWASLGQQLIDPNGTNGQLLTREASILKIFQDRAKSLAINVAGATIQICPISNPTCVVNNAGGPNDIVLVRADLPYKLIVMKKNVTLTSSVTYKNEPYA